MKKHDFKRTVDKAGVQINHYTATYISLYKICDFDDYDNEY